MLWGGSPKGSISIIVGRHTTDVPSQLQSRDRPHRGGGGGLEVGWVLYNSTGITVTPSTTSCSCAPGEQKNT